MPALEEDGSGDSTEKANFSQDKQNNENKDTKVENKTEKEEDKYFRSVINYSGVFKYDGTGSDP